MRGRGVDGRVPKSSGTIATAVGEKAPRGTLGTATGLHFLDPYSSSMPRRNSSAMSWWPWRSAASMPAR
jgi:hypothetical protein